MKQRPKEPYIKLMNQRVDSLRKSIKDSPPAQLIKKKEDTDQYKKGNITTDTFDIIIRNHYKQMYTN